VSFLVVGNACVDRVVRTGAAAPVRGARVLLDAAPERVAGGNGLHVACALARARGAGGSRVELLAPLAEDEGGRFLQAHLAAAGVELAVPHFDVEIAGRLIDPAGAKSLSAIAARYLGIALPSWEDLAGRGAKSRPAGDIEFLGRIDGQLKSKGFRIQPEEVEGALCSHPSVRAALVDGTESETGSIVVRARVERVPGEPVEVGSLQGHCASLLPPAMVPELIEVVDALPRTSRGKLDRRA